MGFCGSAQIGDDYAAFEPIHGTAEDIASRGIANPLGTILAASMMLEWLGSKYGHEVVDAGKRMREAVDRTVEDGVLTPISAETPLPPRSLRPCWNGYEGSGLVELRQVSLLRAGKVASSLASWRSPAAS